MSDRNKHSHRGSYYAGLSGLQLPVPKYRFPPGWENASRLTYYASFFNSIEVNSSFYKIPLARTVSKWAESVKHDFRFTFKLFQGITHAKSLYYDEKELYRFFDVINHVGEKKGCILVQFPPSLKFEAMDKVTNLASQVSALNGDGLWNVCFEFRHVSWYNEDVIAMVRENKANIVRHDIPKSATPFSGFDTAVKYLRFHGPTGNYRGDYDSICLAEFSDYIQQWLAVGQDVFVYFNNTAGNAFENLMTLNRFLVTPTLRLKVKN